MAQEDFPDTLKAFAMITLFIFLVLGAIILFVQPYNKDTTEINERIGLSTVNDTISNAKDTADTWREVFRKTNIFSAFAVMVTSGAFNLFNTMTNFVFTPFLIFTNIMHSTLGIPAVVMDIIYFFVILTLIFGIWKLVRVGGN